jgi:phage terminase Nu1 subunit (DNA packaging protein)
MELNVKPNSDDETVKAAELARRWGVSNRQIGVLTEKGILARGPGGILAWESTRRYLAHLRESASGRTTISDERKRVLTEQADKLALGNAATRAESVKLVDVIREWADTFRELSAKLLAIPDRLASRLPNLTRHDLHEIDAEIRIVLRETFDAYDPKRGFSASDTPKAAEPNEEKDDEKV